MSNLIKSLHYRLRNSFGPRRDLFDKVLKFQVQAADVARWTKLLNETAQELTATQAGLKILGEAMTNQANIDNLWLEFNKNAAQLGTRQRIRHLDYRVELDDLRLELRQARYDVRARLAANNQKEREALRAYYDTVEVRATSVDGGVE